MTTEDLHPWAWLPDFMKQEAAESMLSGRQWNYYGKRVEDPGRDELLRWVPKPKPTISSDIARARERAKDGVQPLRRTNKEKRDMVIALLRERPNESCRTIAKAAGVTHPYVLKIRRKAVTVTTSES